MSRKFLALVFLCVLAGATAHAQSATSMVAPANPGGFYIRGGVNFANITTSASGSYNKANTLTTFNVGIVGDVPLASVLSVQPGVLLSGKGSEATRSLAGVTSTTRFNPLYVEVPVNLVIKLPVTSTLRVFAGAGPYGAVGVGGQWKNTTTAGGDASLDAERNISYGSGNDADLKRFDYGLNGLAGVEIGSLMLGLNYGVGMAKIFPNQNDNANDKNKFRTFSVNAGIRF